LERRNFEKNKAPYEMCEVVRKAKNRTKGGTLFSQPERGKKKAQKWQLRGGKKWKQRVTKKTFSKERKVKNQSRRD